ncbi:hypothetical protein Tco_0089461 [Tanacetum coccineum]
MVCLLYKTFISSERVNILFGDEDGEYLTNTDLTAQELLARQRERKAKSIMLLAILDEYQLRFHAIKDAKTLWAAIKSRFGGNVESKKMQKNVLKQQFENFFVSDTEVNAFTIIEVVHFARDCRAQEIKGNMMEMQEQMLLLIVQAGLGLTGVI